MFVGAGIKHVTIQTIGSRPYIPEMLHVKLDQQRTDRTVANTIRFTLVASLVDGLSSHRRKWDILRITLAITLYSSTPSKSLKRENNQLQLSPTDFVHSLRTRSLRLFTPQSLSPSAGYVPPQVILLLAVSALKFDVVTLAREFIEDWLTKRGQDASLEDATAYEKIIEVYSLHILARLGAWEDAREFMRYEEELPEEVKQV